MQGWIPDSYLPSSTLYEPYCLSNDFTWFVKPALEKQTSQLNLLMQRRMGSVHMSVAISWGN